MIRQVKKIAAMTLSVVMAATATCSLAFTASAEETPDTNTYQTVFDYTGYTTSSAITPVPIRGAYSWDDTSYAWDGKAYTSAKAGDGCLSLYCKGDPNFNTYNDYGGGYSGSETESQKHWLTMTYRFTPEAGTLFGDGIAYDYTLTTWVRMFWRIYANGKMFFYNANSTNRGQVDFMSTATSTTRAKMLYSEFKTADETPMTDKDISAIEYYQICWIPPHGNDNDRPDGATLNLQKVYVINPRADTTDKFYHAVLDYTDYNASSAVTGITNVTTYGWSGDEVGWNQYADRSVSSSDGCISFKTLTTAAGMTNGFNLSGWQKIKPGVAFTLPISAEQLKGEGIAVDYNCVTSNRVFYRLVANGTYFFVDGKGDANNSGIPVTAAGAGQKFMKYESFVRANGTAITVDEIANISSVQICFNPTEWQNNFTVSKVYVYNPVLRTHSYTAQSKSSVSGTVSGGGSFNYNDTVTLTATPAENFVFTGWYRGNSTTAVSTDAAYSFTAVPELGDKVYTAKFASTLSGDVNDDGVMDTKDIVRMKKYVANPQAVEINLTTADVTKTDGVEVNDLVLMRKSLIGAASLTK